MTLEHAPNKEKVGSVSWKKKKKQQNSLLFLFIFFFRFFAVRMASAITTSLHRCRGDKRVHTGKQDHTEYSIEMCIRVN